MTDRAKPAPPPTLSGLLRAAPGKAARSAISQMLQAIGIPTQSLREGEDATREVLTRVVDEEIRGGAELSERHRANLIANGTARIRKGVLPNVFLAAYQEVLAALATDPCPHCGKRRQP